MSKLNEETQFGKERKLLLTEMKVETERHHPQEQNRTELNIHNSTLTVPEQAQGASKLLQLSNSAS